MRKHILPGILALATMLFSAQLAADVLDCEMQLKGNKGLKSLYGLCVAYWSSNENAQDHLLELYRKKAEKLGAPDELLDPPGYDAGGGVPETCPCWNIDDLRQYLACGGYTVDPWSYINVNGESYAGFFDPFYFDMPQLYAGNTMFDFVPNENECQILGLPIEFIIEGYAAISGETEAACLDDIEKLILTPPTMAECEL